MTLLGKQNFAQALVHGFVPAVKPEVRRVGVGWGVAGSQHADYALQ